MKSSERDPQADPTAPREPREPREPVAAPPHDPHVTDPSAPMTLPPAPQRGAALRSGDEIGSYRIVDLLGAGGMGEVYRAHDERLRREVAVKVMRLGAFGPGGAVRARDRLLREAQAMARLSNPNVVTVYEAGIHEDQIFIAMELVTGTTLRAHMVRPPRPWRELVAIFLAAGRGLAAAHRAELVHRDFKPDNVLVGADGRVRVTDFGLAGAPDDDLAGAGAGTPAYMAPEQRDGKRIDARSDQYAFCVSLWEALHGERPPGGESRSVAAWLREVLQRGLAPEPAARFASMEPLLDALGKDPSAARRRRLGALGVVALAGLAAFGLVGGRRSGDPCRGAVAKLAGRWDAAVRAAVRAKFMASGRPYAAGVFDRTAAALDAYAASWTTMREEACLATAVRHEQSAALLDLRMQCLDRRAGELGALTALLADADAAVVDRSTQAATSLTDLTGCADAAALSALVPPPAAEATRRAVAVLQIRLDAARARRQAGRYPEGRALAEAVAFTARPVGYAPLLAEALQLAGDLENLNDDPRMSEASLDEALQAAARAHDDVRAAEIWTSLIWVIGHNGGRPAAALALGPGAAAAVARAGGAPALEWPLESNIAKIYRDAGDAASGRRHLDRAMALQKQAAASDFDRAEVLNELGGSLADAGRMADARAAYEEALDIYQRGLGPDHPHVAGMLNNIANLSVSAGEYARAQGEFERALAIWERGLGPDHPLVALALINLGSVLQQRGKYKEGRAALERAIAIKTKALGPDHPDLAPALSNLGSVLYMQDDYAGARVYYDRALAILEKAKGPDHPDVAAARVLVGRTYQAEGRYDQARELENQAIANLEKTRPDGLDLSDALSDLAYTEAFESHTDAALALARRALAIREKVLGPDSPRVVTLITFVAQLLDVEGRNQEARPEHERAVAILERVLGPDDLALADPLDGLGECLLAMNRPAEAIVPLERAVAIYLAKGTASRDLAGTRYDLAQALWQGNRDRTRAVELARQALDGMQGIEGDRAAQLRAKMAAWLRAHRV